MVHVFVAQLYAIDESLRMSIVSCSDSGILVVKLENVSPCPIKINDYNTTSNQNTFRIVVLNSKMPDYIKLLYRRIRRLFLAPFKAGVEIAPGRSIEYYFDLYDKSWAPDPSKRVYLNEGDEIVVIYKSEPTPNSIPELIWFGTLTSHGFVKKSEDKSDGNKPSNATFSGSDGGDNASTSSSPASDDADPTGVIKRLKQQQQQFADELGKMLRAKF